MIDRSQITGVVLAGGRASRMGGIDKGLVEICGRPMCDLVIELLGPQVGYVVVNANRNLGEYAKFGATVIEDFFSGYLGPLAGVATVMRVAQTPWVITVPCDGPFLNKDYVRRMSEQVTPETKVVVARDSERLQPTFMLASTNIVDDLNSFLASGERKIDKWFIKHNYTTCDFSDSPQCFVNINSEEERRQAETQMMDNERT